MANSYNQSQKLFTRRCIEEALVILMLRIPFRDISISRVCSRAGVSRMAFYRHFDDLEGVLRSYLSDQREEFLSGLTAAQRSDNRILGTHFLGLIEKNSRFFRAIFDGNLHWILLEYIISGIALFYERFSSIPEGTGTEREYRLSFYAGGFIYMIARWLSRDCSEPKEELMSLFLNSEGMPYF